MADLCVSFVIMEAPLQLCELVGNCGGYDMQVSSLVLSNVHIVQNGKAYRKLNPATVTETPIGSRSNVRFV